VNEAPTTSHPPASVPRRTVCGLPLWVWKNLGLYSVGFGLLAYIVVINWNSKTTPSGTTPGIVDIFSRPINPWPFALACVIWVVALFITFARWYLLVRAQDLPFTLWNATRLGLVSYYFNSILPGSVGGDILKAVAVAREQNRRAVAVATILIDRVIGLWALAWLVALAGCIFWALGNPYLLGNEAMKLIVRVTAGIVIGSGTIWLLMGFFSEARSAAVAVRLDRIPKVGHMLSEFWRAGWMYRRKGTAVGVALIMSLVGHMGWVTCFHLCVSSFPDLDSATFAEHLLIVPVGMTAQALFPLPGGIGGGEAAFGWLYTLLGKAAIAGVVGCMVQRVIAWGIGFLGYLVYTRMKREDLPATANAIPPAAADALAAIEPNTAV
jgi:glycosyltransferase 2 family protein